MKSGSFHPGVATITRNSDALRQELAELGARFGTLIVHEQTAWASITFSGTRHRLLYAFEGAEAVDHGSTMIACLPEHEFNIPHQLVADAAVVAVEHRFEPPRLEATLELLLLDED